MNSETEQLLQKWLKLEILKFKWMIVNKIVVMVLIVVSLFLGAKLLQPIISQQMRILNAIQSTFFGDAAMEGVETQSLFEFLGERLTPTQKRELQIFLEESKEATP